MKKWLIGLTIFFVFEITPASKDSAAATAADGLRKRTAAAAEEMPTAAPAAPQIDPLMPDEFRPYEWRVLKEKYLAQDEDIKRKFRLMLVKGTFGQQGEYTEKFRAQNVRLYASLPAIDWFRYVRRQDPERTNSCLETVPCFCCLGVTAVVVVGSVMFVVKTLGQAAGVLEPSCPTFPPAPTCPPCLPPAP